MLAGKIGLLEKVYIADADSLPGVWKHPSEEPRDVGSLFLQLASLPSIVYFILRLDKYVVPSDLSDCGGLPLGDAQLGEGICAVADRYGHRTLDGVHVLAALFDLRPNAVEAMFGAIRGASRGSHGLEDEIIKEYSLKRHLVANDSEWWLNHLRTGQAARLGSVCILRKLNYYLSSPYFPYAAEDLTRYREDIRAHKEIDVTADIGVNAHLRAEIVRQRRGG